MKVNVIKANTHKYSVSAMCNVLQIPGSTYYYEARQKPEENSLASDIREIFRQSRNNYGTRKIKVELAKKTQDETLKTFHIKRALRMKGCPYDNAVAEATFKTIKTEFIKGQAYETLEQLQYELADYVNWFNNHRIHSSLGYLAPKEYRLNNLKKVLTIQCRKST